jgi:hypothetical protein
MGDELILRDLLTWLSEAESAINEKCKQSKHEAGKHLTYVSELRLIEDVRSKISELLKENE